MPDEPPGHRRLVRDEQTVAPNPSRLEVGGLDHEHLALPSAGRKSLPRVRGVRGRMRTAVHPDIPLLLLPLDVGVELDDGLGLLVDLCGDAEIADAAEAIGGGMGLALMLWQRQERGVPTVGAKPQGVVDREPSIVSDIWAG